MKVPNDPEPGEDAKDVVGEIDLPPVEPLTLRTGVKVVVVVPPLPHGQNGQNEGVPAGVGGGIATAPEAVGQRIDGKSEVVKDGGAEEKAPGEQLKRGGAGDEESEHHEGDRKKDGRDHVVVVKESEFGKTNEIPHIFDIGGDMDFGQNPTHMRPKEPLDGGVDVLFGVGVTMVVPMMSRPPERTHLGGRGPDPCQNELKDARSLEGPVGEISVITGSDAEHSDPHQEDADKECSPGETGPENQQAAKMDRDERKTADEGDFAFFVVCLARFRGGGERSNNGHAGETFL